LEVEMFGKKHMVIMMNDTETGKKTEVKRAEFSQKLYANFMIEAENRNNMAIQNNKPLIYTVEMVE
jgi:hypothetical protein